MFAAVLCLATTIFVSSNAGQGVLDILMQY
jgi:hypothetical protein